MSGLDDLLKKATGSSGSGGLGDLLGGLAGGGADSELGSILGGLTGGGTGKGGGMGGLLGGLLPMVGKMLADGGLQKVLAGFQAERARRAGELVARHRRERADQRRRRPQGRRRATSSRRSRASSGSPRTDAASALAQVLPAVVDKVSPDGQLPPAGELDAALGRWSSTAAAEPVTDRGVTGFEPVAG